MNNSKKIIGFSALAALIGLCLLFGLQKLRRMSARITPEIEAMYRVRNGFQEISLDLLSALSATNKYIGFPELADYIKVQAPTEPVYPDAGNPLPRMLPPGTYGRLIRYQDQGTNCPLIWWFDRSQNDVVYMAVNGKISTAPLMEFTNLISRSHASVKFDETASQSNANEKKK